jgi:hypothetical protein
MKGGFSDFEYMYIDAEKNLDTVPDGWSIYRKDMGLSDGKST